MKKPIFRTIIRYEILSDEPIQMIPSLDIIHENCTEGSWSGRFLEDEKVSEELTGNNAVEAIKSQGSDVSFFFMDDEGNDMDYVEDYRD